MGRPFVGYFSDAAGRINLAGACTFVAGLFCFVIVCGPFPLNHLTSQSFPYLLWRVGEVLKKASLELTSRP